MVSNLIFNSSSKELRFNIIEPSESSGYSDVFIPKTIVRNIEGADVFLDGKKIDHTSSAIEDSWLLHFNYIPNAYEVTISLSGASTPFEIPLSDLMPFLLVSIGVILSAIVLYWYKRKR